MKKRVFSILTLMIVVLSAVPADDTSWKEQISRNITLQGGYGTVMKAKFERIPTQSSSFTIGMPFDIEGRLVQYNRTSNGREIAYWSIISNSNFQFTISAQKLTSENPYNGTDNTELDYIMTFTYTFGYALSADERGTKTGSFSFNTETNECTYVNSKDEQVTKSGTIKTVNNDVYYEYPFDIIPSDVDTNNGLIGSVNGSVYFMFTSNATNKIQNEKSSVAFGNYSATITLNVTKK